MGFNSLEFLIYFLPIFLGLYFLTPYKYRFLTFLVSSLIFYGYHSIRDLVILIVLCLVNYSFGFFKKKNKIVFIIYLLINISSLAFFKYNQSFIMPLGFSFYIFNSLSYLIDVYQGKIKAEKNILYLACFMVGFTHVSMGPILHYSDIRNNIESLKTSLNDLTSGFRRFIIGLVIKVLLADNLGLLYVNLLNDYHPSSLLYLLALIVYGLQLYLDFSSYSDMALGLGKILGFSYPENFDHPYLADSISSFWQRWHMSLTKFFKEYIYIPLGGNRVSLIRNILNIMIVWLLTGIWHGSSINFLLWGLYYGVIVVLEKTLLKTVLKKMPKALRHLYVIVLVLIGYLFFSFDNINDINNYLKILFTSKFYNYNVLFYLRENWLLLIFSFICCFRYEKIINQKIIKNIFDILLIILYFLVLAYLLTGSYTPFLYNAF